MKKLYILSPNDRFNYGDLLFAYIVEEHFRDKFDVVEQCSIMGSDMTSVGGMKTSEFHSLYNAKTDDENYLIVAGGECLHSEWLSILGFLDKRINLLEKIFYHIFSNDNRFRVGNALCRKFCGAKTFFPFAIGKNELPNFKRIFYNSLGGVRLANTNRLLNDSRCKAIYKSVDYIAVRDNDSKLGLNKMGQDCFLRADCAILMKETFSEEFLRNRISADMVNWEGKGYIFFQIALNCLHDNETFFADVLNRISEKKGLKICLCPIGRALNHEDHVALRKISAFLKEESFALIENPNIWEIMWLIKHSSIYVGTSLHGAITAMSFDVPFVSHSVIKVKKYLESWLDGESNLFFSTLDELEKKIGEQLMRKYDNIAKKQKKSVLESFLQMESLL